MVPPKWWDFPDPPCEHSPVFRVSTHVDLVKAARGRGPMSSAYTCAEADCIEATEAYIKDAVPTMEPVIVRLPRR